MTERIEAPEVRALIAELTLARQKRAALIEELKAARIDLERTQLEIARVKREITARETEIAISGAAVPEEGFAEEAQVRSAERRGRVMAARIRYIEAAMSESQAGIDGTAQKLKAAWHDFTKEEIRKIRAHYREVAGTLRDLYIEQLAWLSNVRQQGPVRDIQPAGRAMVEDPEGKGKESMLLDSELILSHHPSGEIADDLYCCIRALRTEVEAASR